MKKIFSSFVLLLSISFSAMSQITLTANSFPHIGDKFINHNDTLTASLSPGSGGTNQTWNFAALNNHYNDTSEFVDPDTTPDGAAFPTAQLGGIRDGNYAYFINTATECQIIGVSGSFMGSPVLDIHYTSPSIEAKSGITYNSNYSFISSFLLVVAGADVGYPAADSVKIHNSVYVSKVADGWGTVTSPFGGFPCLRIKEKDSTVTFVDALVAGFWLPNVYSQTSVDVSYNYVDNSKMQPIVTLNMDSTSATVGSAAYRDSWAAGIKDDAKPSLFTVYPNPNSGNDFSILVGGLPNDNYVFQIFDMKGSLVYTSNIFVNKNSVTEINLIGNNFSAGNYSAVVSSENKKLSNIQFSVSK